MKISKVSSFLCCLEAGEVKQVVLMDLLFFGGRSFGKQDVFIAGIENHQYLMRIHTGNKNLLLVNTVLCSIGDKIRTSANGSFLLLG